MNYEEELRLSFYKEIASVNERHGVKLVQHADSGKIYVRKDLKHYDIAVFELIRDGRFPGIPVIKELIETEDSLIVIEDYISGRGLNEMLEASVFSEEQTKEIIVRLCDILEPFHSHVPQIIHRDIKDSNVIIDNEGKVYLIDFDASKMVSQEKNRDTDLIGTEEYAAPEQYGFGRSDQRTDIYAMGILMNRMLTNRFPSEELYGGRLSEVIKKATALDPENRFQTARELKAALMQAGRNHAGTDRQTGTGQKRSGSGGAPKQLLAHLPYPIRELPGFRSGKTKHFVLGLLWYIGLLLFCLLMTGRLPGMTVVQDRFYDIVTFLFLLLPFLYIFNYLGMRDQLPWKKSSSTWLEVLRIGIGIAASAFAVVLAAALVGAIFHL